MQLPIYPHTSKRLGGRAVYVSTPTYANAAEETDVERRPESLLSSVLSFLTFHNKKKR